MPGRSNTNRPITRAPAAPSLLAVQIRRPAHPEPECPLTGAPALTPQALSHDEPLPRARRGTRDVAGAPRGRLRAVRRLIHCLAPDHYARLEAAKTQPACTSSARRSATTPSGRAGSTFCSQRLVTLVTSSRLRKRAPADIDVRRQTAARVRRHPRYRECSVLRRTLRPGRAPPLDPPRSPSISTIFESALA